MEGYHAHIRREPSGEIIAEQSVREHCRNTAAYAAAALAPVGLSAAGEAAGLLHDLGKCSGQFQAYIRDGTGRRGSVNHSFAAVRFLLERFHREPPGELEDIAAELLALAVGAHHGTFDCVDPNGKDGFRHRLTRDGTGYEEALAGFFRTCADEDEVARYVKAAQGELVPVLEKILTMTEESDPNFFSETAFYCGLLARLLLSAVIEGDRRDTAVFMNGAVFPPGRSAGDLKRLWGECLERVEEKLGELPRTSPIDQARRRLSRQCCQAGRLPSGVYRLSLPTGAGKTLSGLRYALAHAKEHSKQRLIFVSPLLSILDQNAKELRKYIQDDSLILEHHSNLIPTLEGPDELDRRELLTETWDAPIIITTLVQFLNTLFSGKTACIRRFHALCGSVILLDEVQSVPAKMLTLFSLAVNLLAEVCGATVVLCSATQPCMEQIGHPIHAPIPELAPYDPALWEVFRRTDIRPVAEELSLDGIAGFARECLETAESLLIVCNKKDQAEALFRQLRGGDLDLFHLSASMCQAHRRETLDRLRDCLDRLRACPDRPKRKAVCISTQVIEAGVDISFGCVIRLCAGLDSVVQAAGRCNRHGEAGTGILAPVYLVNCAGEKLEYLPDIQIGKAAAHEFLAEFIRDPETYDCRLDSDQAVAYYYRALYRKQSGELHDYSIQDRPSLFSMLAENERIGVPLPEEFYFHQAFRTAGALFHVFEDDTTDVVVPYGEGKGLIADLGSERAKRDPAHLKELLNKAKVYTVALYRYQLKPLEEESGLIPLAGGALGLNGHYSEETGFSVDESNLNFLGV